MYGKSKSDSVTQLVSQSVTRSPIELSWTAKKGALSRYFPKKMDEHMVSVTNNPDKQMFLVMP